MTDNTRKAYEDYLARELYTLHELPFVTKQETKVKMEGAIKMMCDLGLITMPEQLALINESNTLIDEMVIPERKVI